MADHESKPGAEAEWLHRTPERVAELTDLLIERGLLSTACPVSQRDDAWDAALDTVVLLNPEPRGLEVVPITCTACSYTRLHSTRHLFH